jgi:dTDP-4-dehydrorhamnose 3,5-epimerase-like enzyme
MFDNWFDVVMDLRRISPSYRRVVTSELRNDDGTASPIAPGCALGVSVLCNDVVLADFGG